MWKIGVWYIYVAKEITWLLLKWGVPNGPKSHPDIRNIFHLSCIQITFYTSKIRHLITKVAWSVNIDVGDRLTNGSRKVKFVINGPLLEDSMFPEGFRDFDVCHHYLQTSSHQIQSRLRKRSSKGKAKVKSTYTHTIRKMVSYNLVAISSSFWINIFLDPFRSLDKWLKEKPHWPIGTILH